MSHSPNSTTYPQMQTDWHLRYRFKETRRRNQIGEWEMLRHIGILEREIDRLNGLLKDRRETLLTIHAFSSQVEQMFSTAKASVACLTTKEKAVYEAVIASRDQPNKVIAEKVGISERCVKFHLENIFKKMGVGCKNEL